MKKLVIYTGMCICFLVCVNTCSAADIYVPDDYTTIQSAIDNAIAYDTIIIRDGTYIEGLDVHQKVNIQSENGTNSVVVLSTSIQEIVNISNDDVVFRSITVNGPGKYTCFRIRLGYDNYTIEDCNISGTTYGIISEGDNSSIIENYFDSNVYDAIHVKPGTDYINITGNIIYRPSRHGIFITPNVENANCFDNIIIGDDSETDYGVGVTTSNNIMIHNNTISNVQYANYIYDSIYINISNSTITNSTNGTYIGDSTNCNIYNNNISLTYDAIYLDTSDNNNIDNNNIYSNTRGVYFASSDTNTMQNNTIESSSAYGMVLLFSNGSIVYNNNFNNTVNILNTFSTSTWNITKTLGRNIIGGQYLGGNYWSSYTGIDTDSDGLGNTLTPYGPGDNLPLVYQPSTPSDIFIFAQHRSAFIKWSDTTSMNPGPYTYNWNITNNTGEIINGSTVNTQTSKIDGLWPGWYNFSINVTDSRSGSMYTKIPFIMTNTADLKIDQPIIGTTGSDIGIIGVIGLFALLFIRRS